MNVGSMSNETEFMLRIVDDEEYEWHRINIILCGGKFGTHSHSTLRLILTTDHCAIISRPLKGNEKRLVQILIVYRFGKSPPFSCSSSFRALLQWLVKQRSQ